MNIKEILKGLVITELPDEGFWLLNFKKYNSEDDIEITPELGELLLKLRHDL